MSNILQDFTATIIAIKELEQANDIIFEKYNQLLRLKGEQEVTLKQEAKETGDQNNGVVKVSVARKFKKWYEWMEFSTDTQKILAENDAVKIREPEVDKEKLEELAKDNIVSRQEIVKAYHEEEMSPAVSIKIL